MRRPLPGPPSIVGIVNVTPDSFSDGGACFDAGRAAAHAERLVAEGASMLDVGAESTRPGARPLPPAEEIERLMPALAAIRARVTVPLCIDTRNAMTARAALDGGADAINDVSMLRHDPALASEAARDGATLILMHSRGTPGDMQAGPRYDDVMCEVRHELEAAVAAALDAGCARDRIVVDPGFGFAKTHDHDLELLRRLPELRALGAPIFVGLSRKSTVGRLLAAAGAAAPRPVAERISGSVGLALAAFLLGADYLRVHDVAATADALRTFRAALPSTLTWPPTGAAPDPRGLESAHLNRIAHHAATTQCSDARGEAARPGGATGGIPSGRSSGPAGPVIAATHAAGPRGRRGHATEGLPDEHGGEVREAASGPPPSGPSPSGKP